MMTIANSQVKFFATVGLNWISTAQGGRKRAIGTADYAATAYFEERDKQLFSIILHFPTKVEDGVKVIVTDRAVMNFLVLEIDDLQLIKGKEFYVTEGSKVVAKGKVLSVGQTLAASNPSKSSRRSKISPKSRRVNVGRLFLKNASTTQITAGSNAHSVETLS